MTLSELISERLKEVKANITDLYIIYGGVRILKEDFNRNPMGCEKLHRTFFTPSLQNAMSTLTYFDINKGFQEGFEKYRAYFTAQKTETKALTPLQQALVDGQTLVIDVISGEHWLWNRKEQRKSTWNVKAYFSKFSPEQIYMMKRKAPFAIRTFDPYRGLTKEWDGVSEGIKVKYLNSYIPPSWYDKDYTPQEMATLKEEYPPFFNYFLEKLIPLPEHREVVLDWICLAIFGRPISYLCLRGLRGSGKSILKLMIYHLVGNFYESQEKVLTEFNADIREKRLVGIDDKKAIGSRDGYYMRKNLLNPTMSYNEKSVQTFQSGRQYASLIILSNNSDKFYMEFDERRIVSPLMGDEKMETWATEQHYNWLRAYEEATISGEHLEFIRKIGRSLLSRLYTRNPSPNIQLKAGYFWSDVLQSLPSFYRFTLQNILIRNSEENELDYEELRATYKLEESYGNIPHWATFSTWLQSGFRFMELPLLDSSQHNINNTNKTFKLNPQLCQGPKGDNDA